MRPRAHPRSCGWLGLALLLGVLLGCTTAAAKTVVAVAPFHGPEATMLEQVVQRTLRARGVVLSSSSYAQVAKSLFAEGWSPEDIAAVAKELGASYVVTGITKLDGGRWTLVITLHEGKGGRTTAKLRYPLTSPRTPPGVIHTMQSDLLNALRGGGGNSSPPSGKPRRPIEPPTSWDPPPRQRTDSPPQSPRDKARDDEWPTQDADRPEKHVGDPPAPIAKAQPQPAQPPPSARPPFATYASGRAKWARYFELGLGISIGSRNFGTDPPPPRFANGVAAGLHAEATFYPLAFTWKRAYGLFSGLGLGLDLDYPFWPPATAKTDTTQQLPIAELRVEGGLRYKITLYKPLPRPQLTLLVEGGVHQFLFARAADGTQLAAVPDVRYQYATIGGRLTVHFADWSWIWAQFQYHIVTDSGPIQLRENYGLAATVGFRFSAGIDFLVWRGIRLGLQGHYERFSSRYGYDPERVQIRDTSTDEFFGGTAVIGYVF